MKTFKTKGLFNDLVFSALFFFIIIFGINSILDKFKVLNLGQSLVTVYDYSDLYYSKFYANPHRIDTSIVLINIGDSDRFEISEVITKICDLKAKCIGIDIIFNRQNETAKDALLNSIQNCNSKIVIIEGEEQFSTPKHVVRANNSIIGDNKSIIKYIELVPSKVLPFSSLISDKKIDSEKLGKHQIDYWGNYKNFISLESSEFLHDSTSYNLGNKFVILGYAGAHWGDKKTIEDRFITPLTILNGERHLYEMSGMEIHANALRNFGNDNFVKKLPSFITYSILFLLLCGLNIYYFFNFGAEGLRIFIRSKLISFFLGVAVYYIAFWIFHATRYYIPNLKSILSLFVSFECASIYITFLKLIKDKFPFNSYMINNKL